MKMLINVQTIRQVDATGVTCSQVELPSHEVPLANGSGTESYSDTGNRGAFARQPPQTRDARAQTG